MADDSFIEPKASEEPYTRIKTLGRGAFGEAVLYRKTEVSCQYSCLLNSTTPIFSIHAIVRCRADYPYKNITSQFRYFVNIIHTSMRFFVDVRWDAFINLFCLPAGNLNSVDFEFAIIDDLQLLILIAVKSYSLLESPSL